MMQHYIIMCRSLTYAQRAARALERAGYYASVAKAPQELAGEGCSYGVRIRSRDLVPVLGIIRRAGIDVGKIAGFEGGKAVEVGL